MNKFLAFCLFSIFFICPACRKERVNNVPYFKFDSVGADLLSELKLNDTIRFLGSNGSRREYRVVIEQIKEVVKDCTWNTGACQVYYYYDHKVYSFSRIDSSVLVNSPPFYPLNLQMQLPAGTDYHNIPINAKASAVVLGNGFVDFNRPPSPAPGPYGWINFLDFYQPTNTISFSNSIRTFTAIVINSGINTVVSDPGTKANYTVNEVWFDKKHGIVFFRDVFGNSWSRIN